MLFALSTGHEIALAVMGGIFVLFALVSSFVLPRRNPDYPGRRIGWFVLVSVLFFIAMISAVIVFGVEEPKASEAGGEPTSTETTTPTTPTETSGGGAAKGDPAAGKKVFASAGCTGCHTLKAAGASGTVGPNLDQAKPDQALIRERVTNGKPPMPAFKGTLSEKQIDDVIAFVYSSTH